MCPKRHYPFDYYSGIGVETVKNHDRSGTCGLKLWEPAFGDHRQRWSKPEQVLTVAGHNEHPHVTERNDSELAASRRDDRGDGGPGSTAPRTFLLAKARHLALERGITPPTRMPMPWRLPSLEWPFVLGLRPIQFVGKENTIHDDVSEWMTLNVEISHLDDDTYCDLVYF